MWMACHTQEEIAAACDCGVQPVRDATPKAGEVNVSVLLTELGKKQELFATHAAEFDPPLYNVWKQQEKTEGSGHFGNSDVRWVDKRIFDMWLACHTQEEIAAAEEVHKDTVSELCRKTTELGISDKSDQTFATLNGWLSIWWCCTGIITVVSSQPEKSRFFWRLLSRG